MRLDCGRAIIPKIVFLDSLGGLLCSTVLSFIERASSPDGSRVTQTIAASQFELFSTTHDTESDVCRRTSAPANGDNLRVTLIRRLRHEMSSLHFYSFKVKVRTRIVCSGWSYTRDGKLVPTVRCSINVVPSSSPRSLKAPATELSGRPEPERSAALPEESSKRPPDRIGHPLAPASPREGLPPSWVDKQPEGGVAGPSSELPVLERSERSGRLGLSETPADLSGGRHPSLEPPNMSAGLPGEKENASGKHAEILMGARKAASRGRKLESENSLRASSPLRKAETETRNLGVAVDLQIDALREELEVRTKEVARLKEVEAEWKRWEETLEKDMETSMRKVEEGKAVLAESRKRTAEERAKVEGNFRELMGQWERKKMQMACLEEALMKETERSAESEARQVEAVSEMAEARGKMEAELTSAKTEAASARAEATSVREALRRAERAAADSEVQRLGAARETAQAREAMRKLGEELTSATAEAASARAEVMSARKALRMETERAEAESNARQLEAVRKTGEAQETMEKLEAELTSARAEVTSIEEALRLETERAGDSEAQRLEAVREMAAAREATQKLGVDVTSAKAEAALARAEVTSVRALLEVRAEEYARSQRKSAHLERKRNAALEGTAELERERNAALERTAELEREPNAALERTAELEQERNTALERTAEAEMERDKAIQQNVQLEKRWNDALTRRAQVAGEARMLAEGKARAKKELGSVYAIVEQIEEGLKGEHEKNVSLLGDLRRDANRGVVAPEEKGLGLVVCANAGNVRKDAVRPSHGPSADVATVADVIQDGTQAPGYCVENTGTVSTRISEGGLPRGASRADACIGTEFTVWEGHVTAADVVKRERDVARREKEVLQTELRLPGLLRGLECERESYRRDLECERESYRRDLECERESYRKKVGDLERIVAELQKTYESKCRARRMARS